MAEEEEPDSNPEEKSKRRRRRRRSKRHQYVDYDYQVGDEAPRWKRNLVVGFFIFNGIVGILIPWAYIFYLKNF